MGNCSSWSKDNTCEVAKAMNDKLGPRHKNAAKLDLVLSTSEA